MRKKQTPEERLSEARNNMAMALLDVILTIGYFSMESSNVSLVLLLLIGGVFLLILSIYYFVTQKAYTDYYANAKPFATPVSDGSLEFTELSPQPESKKESQETSHIFKIYNAIGIIGILVIVLFIFLGQITSVILPIIFIVLIATTIGVALYHMSMNKIPK